MKRLRKAAQVTAGLMSLLLLAGCHRAGKPAAPETLPTASVRVGKIDMATRTATEEVVGTVRPKLKATVEAKLSGRIEQLAVVAGQTVKAGDLLAQLEAREVQARLEQAQAVRDQARQELKRFEGLLRDNAVTRQEFEAVEARFKVAQASVTEAETVLGYARVTAPFGGVITRKLADLGDLAAPGKPLFELEDPAALRIEADVPEAIASRVKPGAKLAVTLAALGRELEGVVSEVETVTDPVSRTLRVKLDLPPTPGLMSGQFGRVAVPVGDSAILRVPATAIANRGQLELVFVVTNSVARMRLVKTGKVSVGGVELVSGLDAGETVVTEGVAGLLDGQPVSVKP